MNEKHITFTELIVIALLFGSPIFAIGRLIQGYLLRQYSASWPLLAVILVTSQILSLILEVVIWMSFKVDPMFHYISIPTVLSEIFILIVTITAIKKLIKK